MDIYNQEKLARELVKTDEYKKANSEILALQEKLMQMLSPESKKLFLQYDEAMANLCDCQNRFYFEKGTEVSKTISFGENIA